MSLLLARAAQMHRSSSVGAATMDPASNHAAYGFAFSNGNLKVLNQGTTTTYAYSVISNIARSSGKKYWEVVAYSITTSQARSSWGVTSRNAAYWATKGALIGRTASPSESSLGADGTVVLSGSTKTTIIPGGVPSGSLLRFRFDLGIGLLECALAGGAWVTMQSGMTTGIPYYVGVGSYYGVYADEGGLFNFGATSFAYPVPAGYDPGW